MRRILTREEWRRRRRRNNILSIVVMIALALAILITTIFIIDKVILEEDSSNQGIIRDLKDELLGSNREGIVRIEALLSNGVEIEEDFLTPNDYSRPQTTLRDINSIVIHYTANPGTTAANNRSYFEGLATKKTTYASSHYIIGLEGEVVQCIPLSEISFASNQRNEDSLSIECCHEDVTGQFNTETYSSLVSLTAALCIEFNLEEEDIIRHYDITEKRCPLYYVEHEEEWLMFRKKVMDEVKEIKNAQKNKKSS